MKALYIDVREKDEWDKGHLDEALFYPLSELKKGNIPQDLPQDQDLLLYCARGGRAKVAKELLLPTYPRVQALEQGYDELKIRQ